MPSKPPELGADQGNFASLADGAPHPALIELAKFLGRITARVAHEAHLDLPLDEDPQLAREIMMITFDAIFLSESKRRRHKRPSDR